MENQRGEDCGGRTDSSKYSTFGLGENQVFDSGGFGLGRRGLSGLSGLLFSGGPLSGAGLVPSAGRGRAGRGAAGRSPPAAGVAPSDVFFGVGGLSGGRR